MLEVSARIVPVSSYTVTDWSAGCNVIYCNSCHKTFNALTGTPLARLREKPKWLNYLASMAQSLTIRQSASNSGVHRNTSFRWRHRFLRWITQDRPSTLHGITEADETYLLESDKGKRNLERKARKRGGDATKRGISDEQVCVPVARDRSGQTLDFVTGKEPLNKPLLTTSLKPVLDVDALLVSDANPTYMAFCHAEGVSHESLTSVKASGSMALIMCKMSTHTTVGLNRG